MPNFIVIDSKKVTAFNTEAKTVLESEKFTEINSGTYFATSSNASTVKTKLKNLESFKKNKSGASIKIYSGTLSI